MHLLRASGCGWAGGRAGLPAPHLVARGAGSVLATDATELALVAWWPGPRDASSARPAGQPVDSSTEGKHVHTHGLH